MELNGQVGRRIIIFSLGAIILPLLVFPARLGTDIARASLISALYELVYFSVVIFFFHRRTTLLRLVQGAGVCLVYRIALGAVFGLLIAAMYSMELRVSLTLGMSGYLPSILFHVALAPFILRPVVSQLFPEDREKKKSRLALSAAPSSEDRSSLPAHTRQQPVALESQPSPIPVQPNRAETTPFPRRTETSGGAVRDVKGFDRAVNYIGEHASVNLAAVVDSEGLLLGSFKRGPIDPEVWAPLALLFLDESGKVLKRGQVSGLEKADLMLKDKRLVVARSEGCYLLVVGERHDDDLLNIRINQALEMIARFVSERYDSKMNANAERIHVPSA